MTKVDVLNSNALKKRFCKDHNLPITVFENPYFEDRLSTLDIVFDCIHKFDVFCDCLLNFNNEQEYFEYYNYVKDAAINCIKSSSKFNDFMCEDVFKTDTIFPRKNLYVSENHDTTFISIDMKKANFSALKHYDAAIFVNKETWETFLRLFTDCEHIIQSKYIRQVILGACNPKRQIAYERYLMNKLLLHIVQNIPNINVYSLEDDEILIKVEQGCGYSKKELQNVVSSCPDGIGQLVRIEIFDLHKIEGADGWTKTIYDDNASVQFKGLNAEIYHQIVKHFYGKPITKSDLVFCHNGKLARFLTKVENPWKE